MTIENQNNCPDCHDAFDFSRRDFVRTAAGAAVVAGVSPLVSTTAEAAPTPKSAAETTVKRLYDSLTDKQKEQINFPYGHKLQYRLSANWKITKPKIGDDFYTKAQREMIDQIVREVCSEDGYDRLKLQMKDDASGGINAYSVAIFGKPGTGKFQWELTGRHLTLRADGDSDKNMAFGGPLAYGHGVGDPKKNVFHYQTKATNEVFKALDPKQRDKALLPRSPKESQAAQPAAVELALATADDDEEVREWAVSALEELGPPAVESVGRMAELLSHRENDVAYWGATLLGRLGDAATPAVAALTSLLADHQEIAVRQRAAWALGEIGPSAGSAKAVLEGKVRYRKGSGRRASLTRRRLEIQCNMAEPLTKTFDLLATTSRPQAQEVLLAALDFPEEGIRDRAVEAILRRDSSLGHFEILRRYGTLNARSQELVQSKSARLGKAIIEALQRGDRAQREGTANLILAAERFEHLPLLIQILTDEPAVSADWVMPVVRDLINRLYDHCRPHAETRKTGSYLRDAMGVKRDTLAVLESAWPRMEDREILEALWEAIFAIGNWESSAVQSILFKAEERTHHAGWEILATSTMPGVMQLVCDALSQSTPPSQAVDLIVRRSDPQFIAHLLRWLPAQLTKTQRKNLERIHSVVWLKPPGPQLELLSDGLQPEVITFVNAIGMSDDDALAVYEWLIRHGSLEARLAATDALAGMQQGLVQSMLYESLDSEDGEVQAWATGQLRERQIPEAIPMLLSRLDSPIDEVREVARDELHSFDLHQALEWFDTLSDRACIRLGEVLQKIDPQAIGHLVDELRHPIQRRRLQAARGAYALKLHTKVVEPLLDLLQDKDVLVRKTVVEILGEIPDIAVIEGLDALLNDPDSRVRESVNEALKNIHRLNR
eukprot:g8331.t1